MSIQKIILAFSGGLDTSACVPFLENQGYEVYTATVNTGGFSSEELAEIEAKAYQLGAKKHFSIDAQDSLYNQFASKIILANYQKGGTYPACVGPERTVITEEIAKICKQENIQVVAHGSTGAGNDQVRFESAIKYYLPGCKIVAPVRDFALTREQEVEFLAQKGFAVDSQTKDYSINVGLLGTTVGGKETKDSISNIPDEVFPTVKPLDQTPDQAEEFSLDFKDGLPVKFNQQKLTGVEIIQQLNKLASKHGFGKDYHTGTTILGTKARIAFEAPALKALIKIHTEIEKLVLTSKQIFYKNLLSQVYGDLIHEGLTFEPLAKNIENFLEDVNQGIEAKVTAEFYKGHLIIKSIQSPQSLLNKNGVYGEENGNWTGLDAKGFCNLYGMESLVSTNN